MTQRVQLQPGDYVSTDGMTEEEYHAVARAFVAAGAPSGEYPNTNEMRRLDFFGWQNGFHGDLPDLFHGCFAKGRWGTRHLTIEQVIGSQEEKSMTPCEKKGYKVGDRFEVIVDNHFYFCIGDEAELAIDDGTTTPIFYSKDGHPDICVSLRKVQKIEPQWTGEGLPPVGSEVLACWMKREAFKGDTPEPVLIKGIFGSQVWFARQSGEEVVCMLENVTFCTAAQRAEDEAVYAMMDDIIAGDANAVFSGSALRIPYRAGYRKQPTEDLTDPANWRNGDQVCCVSLDRGESGRFVIGNIYTVHDADGSESPGITDEDDDKVYAWASDFRFHLRPQL